MNSESGRSAVSSQVTGIAAEGDSSGEFGANEWLVDEMYELYVQDKNLVDASWWPVLENYHSTIIASQDAAPAAPETVAPAASAAPIASAAPPTEPSAATGPPTGSQPVARTTSVQAKPQPIPADAPAKAPTSTPASSATASANPVP